MSRRPATPNPNGSRSLLPWVIGAIVLLGIAAVALTVVSGDDNGGGNVAGLEQTRPVSVSGDPLPPLGEGPDPAVGGPAPEVSGADFGGDAVTVDHGTPTLLVFLAHWCPACQQEAPVLAEWLDGADAVDGVDVRFVATSTTSDRPNFPPSEWLADEELEQVPTVADDTTGTTAQAFGLTGFPFYVAIDADGIVVSRGSGMLEPEQLDQLAGLAAGGLG